MPILSCYVDDRTLAILQREAQVRGRGETPEQLAEAAIENAAITCLPGGLPGSGQHWEPAMDSRARHGSNRDRVRYGMGGHDDPALGRESELRPGFYEGDME